MESQWLNNRKVLKFLYFSSTFLNINHLCLTNIHDSDVHKQRDKKESLGIFLMSLFSSIMICCCKCFIAIFSHLNLSMASFSLDFPCFFAFLLCFVLRLVCLTRRSNPIWYIERWNINAEQHSKYTITVIITDSFFFIDQMNGCRAHWGRKWMKTWYS